MYDPTTGRWTTQDPIGFSAGDADLYRYVGNNPTNATDPTGLYQRDVHFYMTYYLALKLGLGDISTGFTFPGTDTHASLAFVIAWADQQTDANAGTGPYLRASARRMSASFPNSCLGTPSAKLLFRVSGPVGRPIDETQQARIVAGR